MSINPAYLLHEARHCAGLTQRELAKRAVTAQSVIARIETGRTDPSTATLNHLIEAAGFNLDAELTLKPVSNSHMLEGVNQILNLSPEERLIELASIDTLLKEAKRV